MKFTKMHGIGNDYVYVNCLEEELPMDAGRLAELVSDRHFGIGSDGLVLIGPSEVADFRMDIYNADGSQAVSYTHLDVYKRQGSSRLLSTRRQSSAVSVRRG